MPNVPNFETIGGPVSKLFPTGKLPGGLGQTKGVGFGPGTTPRYSHKIRSPTASGSSSTR